MGYFPIVAYFIVTDCVSRLLPTLQEGKEVSPSLIELITYEFCTWLHEMRMTQLKVSLPDDFKLDYQVVATPGRKVTPSRVGAEREEEGKEDGSEEISDNPVDVLEEDAAIDNELDL